MTEQTVYLSLLSLMKRMPSLLLLTRSQILLLEPDKSQKFGVVLLNPKANGRQNQVTFKQ